VSRAAAGGVRTSWLDARTSQKNKRIPMICSPRVLKLLGGRALSLTKGGSRDDVNCSGDDFGGSFIVRYHVDRASMFFVSSFILFFIAFVSYCPLACISVQDILKTFFLLFIWKEAS